MLDNSVCSSQSKRKSSKPSRYSSKNSGGITSKASRSRKASFNPSPNTSSDISQSSASAASRSNKVSSSNAPSTTSMSFDRQSSSSSSASSGYMAPSPSSSNMMGSTGDNKKKYPAAESSSMKPNGTDVLLE